VAGGRLPPAEFRPQRRIPFVREEKLPEVKQDLGEALRGCRCACLVTAHAACRKKDLNRLARAMANPLLIDGRSAVSEPLSALQVFTLEKMHAQ